MCRESLIDFSKYEIFEDGKIWSKHFKRFCKFTETKDEYLRGTFKKIDGSFDSYLINRVIYFYFNGDIPEDMKVNHIDENKKNNSISNLNLLSHEDNCNWGTRNERISKSHTGVKIGEMKEETKKKISESQKGKTRINQYKQVYLYHNGELIAVYDSQKRASEETGFSKSCISLACRGCLNKIGNHHLGDFDWYECQL